MNPTTRPSLAHLPPQDTLQDRLALRLAAGLDEVSRTLPHDIDERLRVARGQALARARERRAAAAGSTVVASGSAAALGGWWMRLASVLPLVLLVAGLVAISHGALQEQVDAAADVDTALLADDLPPAAYSDPGFLAFLKNPPLPEPTTTTQ